MVDVKLREGDRQKYVATGGIGLISSRLTLEGPINRKGSFIVSGRRTYFDIFTRAINRANAGKEDYTPIPDYYFYDLNAKANYTLGEKDQLFLTGYLGRDVFGFSSTGSFNFSFSWGNTLGVLRWQHTFSPKLLVNTSVSISDYQYNLTNKFDQFSFSLGSAVRDYTARTDFEYTPTDRHQLKFGALATQHRFGVGRLQAGASDGSINFGNDISYGATEGAVYAGDSFKASDKWQLEGRGAPDWLPQRRPAVWRHRAPRGGPLRLQRPDFAEGQLRADVSVRPSGDQLGRFAAHRHLVSVAAVGEAQRSQQVSAGGSFLLGKGKYLLTNEVYYKWGQNQIDFRDGAQLFVNPNLDQEFIFGRSWSYGNELYLEKKEGRTTGWVGYTLAWSWRNFQPQLGTNGVNNGQDFHPTTTAATT